VLFISSPVSIDTLDEVDYYKNSGILPYVLRDLIKQAG